MAFTATHRTHRRPAAVRLAAWSAGHPGRAVGGWLLIIVLCVGAGWAAGTNKGTFSDFWVGEAGRAESIAAAGGLATRPVEHVLLTARDDEPLDLPTATAVARAAAVELRNLPEVAEVGEPVSAADGSAVRLAVALAGDVDSAKRSVRPVLAWTAQLQARHPGLAIAQTGNASISVGVNDKQGSDLARTELISLPITFLVLLLVFGGALAAGIPVVLALAAFLGSVGLYGLASWIFPDAGGAAVSVVFLLGMAVGVDYSLFYLKRVREERARSGATLPHATAVEVAAATSGRAITTSGVAVVVSLAGLYLVDDVIFSSIATGAILVVAVAVASSLTVLPALLVVLGRHTDGRVARRAGPPGRGWARVLRPALRRPVATLVIGGVVTATLALPVTTMRLGTEGKETFPTSVPAVAAYGLLTRSFPAEGAQHLVVVRADPALSAQVAAGLAALVAAATTPGDPLYAPDAVPVIRSSPDRATSVVLLPVGHPANSAAATASLLRLRTQLLPAAFDLPGVEYAVSGEVAAGVDYAAHQASRILWVIGFVSFAALLVMLFAVGSLVLAGIGVVINLAAVLVTWGVLTVTFQSVAGQPTWAEGVLGFTSTGFIGSRMPLMLFAILVGLSTDYQIFVVSRICEAVLAGVPTRRAVLSGIAGSASVVTSAAVIMISVFLSFLFIDRIEMKQVGVGLTAAVLFDALVLRVLILPAAMTVLGDRCWWPARPPLTRSR